MGTSTADMTAQLADSMNPQTGMYDPTYAAIQQLGKSSANPEKLQALQRQAALSKYLREGPNMPSGQYIPGYKGIGHYVAPSALQTLASGLQYGLGAKQGMDQIAKEGALADEAQKNRAAVMSMIYEQAQHQKGDQDTYDSLNKAIGHPDISSFAGTPDIDSNPYAPKNTNLVTPPAKVAQKPKNQLSWDDYVALQQPQ